MISSFLSIHFSLSLSSTCLTWHYHYSYHWLAQVKKGFSLQVKTPIVIVKFNLIILFLPNLVSTLLKHHGTNFILIWEHDRSGLGQRSRSETYLKVWTCATCWARINGPFILEHMIDCIFDVSTCATYISKNCMTSFFHAWTEDWFAPQDMRLVFG